MIWERDKCSCNDLVPGVPILASRPRPALVEREIEGLVFKNVTLQRSHQVFVCLARENIILVQRIGPVAFKKAESSILRRRRHRHAEPT